MRVKGEKVDIDYANSKSFYESRGAKYSEEYPYVTIMLQDQNPQLTDERNRAETTKILPLLQLDETSRVLDLGCGIGRWADSITCPIESYLGVDFSENLVQIARSRNTKKQFFFEQMSIFDFNKYYESHGLRPFNRLIIANVFMYLNDEDAASVLRFLPNVLSFGAIAYILEPKGNQERLTLKDFYSQELECNYNAIYRSAEEYRQMFQENAPALVPVREGFLFDNPALNNRKETSQYYFIFRKSIRGETAEAQ